MLLPVAYAPPKLGSVRSVMDVGACACVPSLVTIFGYHFSSSALADVRYGTYFAATVDETVIVGTATGLAGWVTDTVELAADASPAEFFETTLYEYVVPLVTPVSNQRCVRSFGLLSVAGPIVAARTLFR